jgi:hypothetical protein
MPPQMMEVVIMNHPALVIIAVPVPMKTLRDPQGPPPVPGRVIAAVALIIPVTGRQPIVIPVTGG